MVIGALNQALNYHSKRGKKNKNILNLKLPNNLIVWWLISLP
jgi:hypothetical protein